MAKYFFGDKCVCLVRESGTSWYLRIIFAVCLKQLQVLKKNQRHFP